MYIYIYLYPYYAPCAEHLPHVWSSFIVHVGKCSIHGAFGYIHTCIVITRNKKLCLDILYPAIYCWWFQKKNNAANPKTPCCSWQFSLNCQDLPTLWGWRSHVFFWVVRGVRNQLWAGGSSYSHPESSSPMNTTLHKKTDAYRIPSMYGIFTYIWLTFMVNVDR